MQEVYHVLVLKIHKQIVHWHNLSAWKSVIINVNIKFALWLINNLCIGNWEYYVFLVCDDEWDIDAHKVKIEAIHGRLSNSTNVTLACDDALQN